MAERWCDHGAYTGGAFTGSISGATLTVTAVTSGLVCVGSCLVGAGILEDTLITGAGTGTGGVGTYTLNRSYTLASRAMTAENGVPWSTPTWGVAQDGDGQAKGLATSATVSINLSAATAAAGATFIVMGAVLTCVASGAGANQFNAGSGATLVANLVAAINRTNNTVTCAAQATDWNTNNPVQNVVFARVGTPTTTLQIMTRAGSAQYNTSQITTTGFTGGTYGPYTFAGGASGCWGQVMNLAATIWPSGAARATYGLFPGRLLAGTPGGPSGGHFTHTRSGKRLFVHGTSGIPGVQELSGTPNSYAVVRIDDGTQWPDGSEPVLTISIASSVNSFIFGFGMAYASIQGQKYLSGKHSIRVIPSTAWGDFPAGSATLGVNTRTVVAGLDFDMSGLVTNTNTNIRFNWGSSGHPGVLRDVTFRCRSTNPFVTADGSAGTVYFDGLTLDSTGAVAPNPRVMDMRSATNGATYILRGARMVGFLPTSSAFGAGDTVANESIVMIFEDTQWGNVSGRSVLVRSMQDGRPFGTFLSTFSNGPLKEFSLNLGHGYCDWDASLSFPTCNARLLDGVTPWSIRVAMSVSALASTTRPYELPRFAKVNSLPDGVRTLSVEMAIEDSILATADRTDRVSMTVTYTQTDGSTRTISSFNWAGAPLTPSTATWSAESGGKVVFNPGNIQHTKRKLSVTTPTAIKSGTEIGIVVGFHFNSSTTMQTIFVDPEITVA
jgi:hypothetical protein